MTPSLLEFSQVILHNPEFQEKLVQNINQVLQSSEIASEKKNTASDTPNDTKRRTRSSTNQTSKNEADLNDLETTAVPATSSQLLDQLVKEILSNTEKDPTFDAIIEEAVDACVTKSQISTGAQCSSFINANTRITPQSTNSFDDCQHAPDILTSGLVAAPAPCTPLIIRTAAIAGTPINPIDAQASFGSLIDPNFSISKLIVLNSNESAQKQQQQSGEELTLGNTTADNLLHQLAEATTTPSEAIALSDPQQQVYFDANTGQLTLPLYFTTDNLLSSIPFLINNELITQHLQPENIANLNVSRIEIPLPEPIIFSADQLPPNSIIVGGSTNSQNTDAESLQRSSCKAPNRETTTTTTTTTLLPASLQARLNVERVTPSTSGIVSSKAFKSLSTPRKRASHVRTLTFSPRTALAANVTPLSTRRAGSGVNSEKQKCLKGSAARLRNRNTLEMDQEEEEDGDEMAPHISDNAAIREVEISTSAPISGNESSSSVAPSFFVLEEGSNQTVINLNIPQAAQKTQRSQSTKTPQRKSLRKNTMRTCKKMISKSVAKEAESQQQMETQNDDVENAANLQAHKCQDNLEKDNHSNNNSRNSNNNTSNNKNNTSTQCQENEQHENLLQAGQQHYKNDRESTHGANDEMLEEWVRMRRTATTNDLESRLREINCKILHNGPKKRCVKKVRKRRGKAAKKAMAAKGKTRTNKGGVKEIDTTISLPEESNVGEFVTTRKIRKTTHKVRIRTVPSDMKRIKRTAKKKNKPLPVEKEKEEIAEDVGLVMLPKNIDDANNVSIRVDSSSNSGTTNSIESQLDSMLSSDCKKDASNMASLLETPLKESSNQMVSGVIGVPPTPGIAAFETPLTKVKASAGHDDDDEEATITLPSTSYLFGSLTKSELDTPILSAITPGSFKFTPFGSKNVTPCSGTATEYSSGGSYYRPDESENVDQKLRSTTPKAMNADSNQNFEVIMRTDVAANNTNVGVVEISAEKLRVEPLILKRVKSFISNDGADAISVSKYAETETELPNVEPHYTLSAGLPDNSDAEEAVATTSSSSSESSSAAASTSSFSSSPTSQSSHVPDSGRRHSLGSEKSNKHMDDSFNSVATAAATPKKGTAAIITATAFSLENLSEISSAEDEEWIKQDMENENSQLVSNNGEVRYPVRSWMTPLKSGNSTSNITTPTATTATTTKIPEKSPKSNNNKLTYLSKSVTGTKQCNPNKPELEEKRLRVKLKLRRDSEHLERLKQSVVKGSVVLQQQQQRLQLLKERTEQQRTSLSVQTKKRMQASSTTTPQKQLTLEAHLTEPRLPLDVLTALNLSAKKKQPLTLETSAEASTMGDNNMLLDHRSPEIKEKKQKNAKYVGLEKVKLKGKTTTATAEEQSTTPSTTTTTTTTKTKQITATTIRSPQERITSNKKKTAVKKAPAPSPRKCIQTEAHSIRVKGFARSKKQQMTKTVGGKTAVTGEKVVAPAAVRVTEIPKATPMPKFKIKAANHIGAAAAAVNRMTTKPKTKSVATKKTLDDEKEYHRTNVKEQLPKVKSKAKSNKEKESKMSEKKEIEETKPLIIPSSKAHKVEAILLAAKSSAELNKEQCNVDETEVVEISKSNKEIQNSVKENKEEEKIPILRSETLKESSNIDNIEITTTVAATAVKQAGNNNDNNENDDDDADISMEYDSMDGCVLTSFTENDSNFIRFVYETATATTTTTTTPPSRDSLPRTKLSSANDFNPEIDLNNFLMEIGIDGNEQFSLQITPTYCLYQSEPTEMLPLQEEASKKLTPKKRKSRLTANTAETTTTTNTTLNTNTNTNTSTNTTNTTINTSHTTNLSDANATAMPKIKLATNCNKAAAATTTSTPLSNVKRVKESKVAKEESSIKKIGIISTPAQDAAKVLPAATTTTAKAAVKGKAMKSTVGSSLSGKADTTAGSAEKIKIEDIESILSHLHGT